MKAESAVGWKAGVAPMLLAVRTHWKPFVLIQVAAVSVVVCYYLSPAFQSGAAVIAHVKAEGGLAFAGLSAAFAAVVLPGVAKRVFDSGRRKIDWADYWFQICLFAFLGVTVDLLYRGLGVVFGEQPNLTNVLKKLAVDQLLYSPLVSITFCTLIFLWKDVGFSSRRTIGLIHDGTFAKRYVGNMIACWLFWIPALAAIYSMPQNLQFCLYLCVEAAWALLLVTMAGRE